SGSRTDLLVLLGIYAAALIQVAVTAANLNLPELLDVEEAEKLSKQLLTQQRYWVGLFLLIVLLIVVLLFTTYAKTDLPAISKWLDRLASALLGLLFGFLADQTFNFMAGLLSLQKLRRHYLVVGARRRGKRKAET